MRLDLDEGTPNFKLTQSGVGPESLPFFTSSKVPWLPEDHMSRRLQETQVKERGAFSQICQVWCLKSVHIQGPYLYALFPYQITLFRAVTETLSSLHL